MDLTFDLKSLLKRVHGVLQELLLIFVFHFDVLVDIFVPSFLILHEVVQALIHCLLQCVLVIDVLNNFMTGVLEVFNDHIVISDDITAQTDSVPNLGLSHAQVFYHKA